MKLSQTRSDNLRRNLTHFNFLSLLSEFHFVSIAFDYSQRWGCLWPDFPAQAKAVHLFGSAISINFALFRRQNKKETTFPHEHRI